jgi:hypothetical protein
MPALAIEKALSVRGQPHPLTPLQIAAMNGQPDVVALLLEHKADINNGGPWVSAGPVRMWTVAQGPRDQVMTWRSPLLPPGSDAFGAGSSAQPGGGCERAALGRGDGEHCRSGAWPFFSCHTPGLQSVTSAWHPAGFPHSPLAGHRGQSARNSQAPRRPACQRRCRPDAGEPATHFQALALSLRLLIHEIILQAGLYPFDLALRSGDAELLRLLVPGTPHAAKDAAGRTPLIRAAQHGAKEAVAAMLDLPQFLRTLNDTMEVWSGRRGPERTEMACTKVRKNVIMRNEA